MSRWLLLLSLALPALALAGRDIVPTRPVGTSATQQGGQVYAVVVGISDFQHLGSRDDLTYGEADASFFAAELQRLSAAAIPARNVTRLVGQRATRDAVWDAVDQTLAKARGPSDTVVLYFATHGVLMGGEGYLLAWDSHADEDLPQTSLSLTMLDARIRQGFGNVLVLTDACHSAISGASGLRSGPTNPINAQIEVLASGRAQTFHLASSLINQESREGPEYCGGHGAFTCALVKALRGEADENGDGAVDLGELASRIPMMVRESTGFQQTPEPKGRYDQGLVISHAEAGVAVFDPSPGTLAVTVRGGGTVFLDGQRLEKVPAYGRVEKRVPPGVHRLRVGGEAREVEVVPGERTLVELLGDYVAPAAAPELPPAAEAAAMEAPKPGSSPWGLEPAVERVTPPAPRPSSAIEQTITRISEEAAGAERRVLRASDVRGETLSDEYRRLARQKRHESLSFLKEILSQGTVQGEQKAEMILRLADLYFEEGRDIHLDEKALYEEALDSCPPWGGCEPGSVSATDYFTESRDWQEKSIRLYRQVLADFPQYQRADEATYYLACALADTDQDDEAVKEFTRLVRTYPESRYVPDSYVMIGEYYFDKDNAYKALVAYQKAAAYRDSDRYPFALYKLAWCYYNVGEFGKGIDTMKAVVTWSTEATQAASVQLRAEALKDLVRFFADAGEMDEAYAYFNTQGEKELIRAMLKRLATTYLERDEFEQCIQTYRRLIAEDPQNKDAPGYQSEIVDVYTRMGRKQETLAEIDRLLTTYGRNSAWARANAANEKALRDAVSSIERNLRKVAVSYHTEAKKLGTGQTAIETYALAYKAYAVYLQEFPDHRNTYEMRYSFGELLYKIKKYDEAYVQYMKVVEIDPRGKHSEFCAESAIFAADEMIKREASGDSVALSEWGGKLISAFLQFTTLFPESDRTSALRAKVQAVVDEHPGTTWAQQAQRQLDAR